MAGCAKMTGCASAPANGGQWQFWDSEFGALTVGSLCGEIDDLNDASGSRVRVSVGRRADVMSKENCTESLVEAVHEAILHGDADRLTAVCAAAGSDAKSLVRTTTLTNLPRWRAAHGHARSNGSEARRFCDGFVCDSVAYRFMTASDSFECHLQHTPAGQHGCV